MENKEQVLISLKGWLTKNNYQYDTDIGLELELKDNQKLRDGRILSVYIVSFKTVDTITYDSFGEIDNFTEGMYCWAYYDSVLLELIYILKTSGYIEPDGSF